MTKRGDTWWVSIVDPDGRPVSDRTFSSEQDAGVYASSVLRHVKWVSEERFREYYRLQDPPTDPGEGRD